MPNVSISYQESNKATIQKIAYDYILAILSDWYCQDKEIDSTSEFNQVNEINTRQAMLMPFFTCSANGSTADLFDLFAEFYALHDGPVSKPILLAANSNELNFFDIDIKGLSPIKLKTQHLGKTWNQIIDEILNFKVKFEETEDQAFKSISYTHNNQKLIYKSIENSIKAIQKHSNNEFIRYSDYEMITIARQYRCWSIPFEMQKSKPQSEKSIRDLLIDKAIAVADRKIYKPLAEDEFANA